jgi:lipopolysaccharide export system protein LptA
MRSRFIPFLLAAALALPTGAALAQGTTVAFGGLKADTRLPVEVTADVVVTQGEMRMQAGEIRVEYDATGKAIARLLATGGVIVVNATDAAEAAAADYTIATGEVVMTGGVLMTQGQAAIKGDRLVINLKTGTGRMEGGVTTTFTPGGD